MKASLLNFVWQGMICLMLPVQFVLRAHLGYMPVGKNFLLSTCASCNKETLFPTGVDLQLSSCLPILLFTNASLKCCIIFNIRQILFINFHLSNFSM